MFKGHEQCVHMPDLVKISLKIAQLQTKYDF